MDTPDPTIIACILEMGKARSVFTLETLILECPEVENMLTGQGT